MNVACAQDLSVHMQTVNVLPWELEDKVADTLALLAVLSADLHQGKIDRTIPTPGGPAGRTVPAFEYLVRHMSGFDVLKLQRFDKSGSVLGEVALVLPDAMRTTRASPFVLPAVPLPGNVPPQTVVIRQVQLCPAPPYPATAPPSYTLCYLPCSCALHHSALFCMV